MFAFSRHHVGSDEQIIYDSSDGVVVLNLLLSPSDL